MDRIDEWRAFAAVATLRSFSEAARSLGRSPQAITRAVASLEERLATRLLHRTTRSVSLSAEGARLLERGRCVLEEFDALESLTDRGALVGTVVVTAPVLFGRLHVLPVVQAFLAEHSGVDVRLQLIDRVVSLAEEGVDVAVRIGALPDSALRARHIGDVREVVCASPAYLRRAGEPRSPEALSEHACIAFTATTPIPERWSFPRPGSRERAVRVRARLIVNTGQAAIDAAVAGVGVVRVLSYQVAALVADGHLRVILRPFERESSPVHIVQLAGIQPRAVPAFVECAAQALRERLSR